MTLGFVWIKRFIELSNMILLHAVSPQPNRPFRLIEAYPKASQPVRLSGTFGLLIERALSGLIANARLRRS